MADARPDFLVLTPISRRPLLVIFVRCAGTGRPMEGALVSLESEDPRFNRILELKRRQHGPAWDRIFPRLDAARTSADGVAWFTDLPPADYTARASIPALGRRYGDASAQVSLAAGEDGQIQTSTVELLVSPTTLEGVVTDADEPLAMAEVRVDDGSERAFTGADGRYAFIGLEPGAQRRVSISVRGQILSTTPVDVVAAATTTLDLAIP